MDSGDHPPTAEEARLLALLDDSTKASIGTMFMGREENGTIAMDQLTEIMTELQVAFDPEMLSKVVPEEDWDKIDLNLGMLAIAYCIDAAQKQVAEQAKADSAVVVAQAAQPVVYLNTMQYLLHLTPCGTKEEGVEYRWNKVKLDVRPKTILMVSVAFMMVVAAVALIAAVIGLNERATNIQASQSLRHLGATVHISSGVLFDEAIHTVMAASLQSTSDTIANLADGLLASHENAAKEQLSVGLSGIQASLTVAAEAVLDDRRLMLNNRINTVLNMFASRGSLDNLFSIAKGWEAESLRIVISDSSGVRYRSNLCDNSTVPSPLRFPSLSASGITLLCGNQVRYSCGMVSRLGVLICLAENHTASTSALVSQLDEMVTDLNLLRPESSVELQAALRQDDLLPIGGRKNLPMLCIRTQVCDLGQELFLSAMNSTGTRILQGYDAAEWISAFAHSDVENHRLLFGLKEDRHDLKRRFFDAIGTTSRANASDAPNVVFAIADRFERVELLPLNDSQPSLSQESYLAFALNARRGVSFPTHDPQSLMAGYDSALLGDLAVGVEYSAAEASQSSMEFISRALSSLNGRLPLRWSIVAARRSQITSPSEYFIPERCSQTACTHEAIERGFQEQGSGEMDALGLDGTPIRALYRFYDGTVPLVIVVQYNLEDLKDTILNRRYIALGVGVAVIVAVQLIILLLTRRVLDRIENDYNKYKRQIEDEKHQFSELVKDVMPPYIAERIMKGTRLIAETHPQLTFFFSDIVGSTEASKTLTHKHLVRMLGYTFMLEDEIASYFGVHKIKTIGDAYFAVSGLEDNQAGGATQGKDHQVYRMVSFACICQQLFGPTYQHFPEKTECFRISAQGQKLEPMKMVRMRMGIHTGPAVAGVVDVGRAPHFDCFGPSVNLASRMESTSSPGRVQISGPTYEILSKLDKDGLFEYEPPRKTLVKGYGTMITYLVKSTNLPIPEELIDRLFIERANQRQYFANERAIEEAEARQKEMNERLPTPKDTPVREPTPSSHPKESKRSKADHVEQTRMAPPVAPPLDPLATLLPNLAPLSAPPSAETAVVAPRRTPPSAVETPSGNVDQPLPPQAPFQGFAFSVPPPPPPPEF